MIPRLLFYLHRLRRELWLEPAKLRELQTKRLRATVKHAYENVSFYHKKFDAAGVKPDDIRSVADLVKVPVTTKAEVQASSLQDVVARNVTMDKCVLRTTSGSTGLPLVLVVDRRVLDFEGAVWMRALFENGLRLGDRMAVIGDPRSFLKGKSVLQRFGIMRSKYISIFDDAERQRVLLDEYKPDVIKSYPSSLTILAHACQNSKKSFRPHLVFTSAELLDSASRRFINSMCKVELLDNYACSEFSLLAWECHKHAGYHINSDGVVVEFVDDGESVAFGERGEIVCTSLFNDVMPLIRYRIGDSGIPMEAQCSCERVLPLMKIVEGRTDDFLLTVDGRMIAPTVFFPYPFESFEGIRQFRVIQEKKDKLRIQLVADEAFLSSGQVFERARGEIQKLFGQEMQVDFQILDKIPRDYNGKLRKVISKVRRN